MSFILLVFIFIFLQKNLNLLFLINLALYKIIFLFHLNLYYILLTILFRFYLIFAKFLIIFMLEFLVCLLNLNMIFLIFLLIHLNLFFNILQLLLKLIYSCYHNHIPQLVNLILFLIYYQVNQLELMYNIHHLFYLHHNIKLPFTTLISILGILLYILFPFFLILYFNCSILITSY